MPSKTKDSGELALLRALRKRAARSSSPAVRLGIGDDCALLRARPGEEFAVTTDLSIAGRHFRLDWHSPESVGHRALARGLSDLAAMGARPLAAFLSLAVPRSLTNSGPKRPFAAAQLGQALAPHWPNWTQRFLNGLLALAEVYKTPLAGGDLAESPLPFADIALVGAVPRGQALLRSAARPGQVLYVTGALGGSAVGLAQLALMADASGSTKAQPPNIPKKLAALLAAHLYPEPRIAQGLKLRGLASAAIDLSDGLSTDLAHLCEESQVAAEIDAALLPLHPAATLPDALHGGEDYELLFTAPPSARIPKQIAGVPITRIGRIVKLRAGQPRIVLITREGRESLEPQGWEHFS